MIFMIRCRMSELRMMSIILIDILYISILIHAQIRATIYKSIVIKSSLKDTCLLIGLFFAADVIFSADAL